ncbi:hypothetical protein ACSBR2_027523 [Camellia fascicularis]
MPIAVYSIENVFRKDSFNSNTMANMLSISFGVAIAAYGETKFDSWGGYFPFPFRFRHFWDQFALCFALNLVVFLLVGKTSTLTMNVAGVVNDWLLIAFLWSVIKDTMTLINLFGYGLAFLSVMNYNHSKLQALKAKEAQKKAQ